jgi:hypothetical protein
MSISGSFSVSGVCNVRTLFRLFVICINVSPLNIFWAWKWLIILFLIFHMWRCLQMERVNLNAIDGGGGYYKLSAFLDMSSDRTKVCVPFPSLVYTCSQVVPSARFLIHHHFKFCSEQNLCPEYLMVLYQNVSLAKHQVALHSSLFMCM